MKKELKEKIDKLLSDALFDAAGIDKEEYDKIWEMQEMLNSINVTD